MVTVAVLWDSEVGSEVPKPFDYETLNNSYEAFSNYASGQGVEVAIAKYSWMNEGEIEKAYVFQDGEWIEKKDLEIDVVFDKFKFDEETVELKKKLNSVLPVLNDFELERMCKDKLDSYMRFPEHIPETREATKENLREFLREDDKAVIKPRYDFGGEGVKVVEEVSELDPEDELVQRFVEAGGIPGTEIEGIHDLRFYVLNGEIEMCYVRRPESGYISNLQQGGTAEVVELEDVPENVLEIVEELSADLREFNPSLYSVDMLVDSAGNPYVLELNSKPGLAFHGDEDLERAKRPLMKKVVETLVRMS